MVDIFLPEMVHLPSPKVLFWPPAPPAAPRGRVARRALLCARSSARLRAACLLSSTTGAGDPAVFEFEVECIKPEEYFQQEYHTDEYIATSLLVKLKDFLPSSYHKSHLRCL